MKGIKSFYTGAILIAIVVFCSVLIGQRTVYLHSNQGQGGTVVNTDFGSFLATQHALYVNDFESASKMINTIESDVKTVKEIKSLTDFFGGKMPENAADLKKSKDLISRLIYDAYLIQKDDWKNVYERHKKDDSVIASSLRIFATAKQGKNKDAIKFVDSLKVNESLKAFIRGQIAVLKDDIDGAAKEFAKVHPEFMNINDYLYLMSFYQKNGMTEDMDILRNDFIAKPGGMYVLNYNQIPDWKNFDGYKNNLVFSMIQTISHTQFLVFTDLSLTFLRFAQIISSDTNLDAINYYLGQYYFYNSGDYEKCFKDIDKNSPLYLFGQIKIAEKNKDMKTIEKIARKNPLFIPAVNIVVREHIKNGNKHSALRFTNRGLKQSELTDEGRIYFLKQRAYIYLMFDDVNNAQQDISKIKDLDDSITPDIMLLQARVWEKQNRNLDEAYKYVMTLVKLNSSDINAWDTMALIVNKKENVVNALDILEHVVSVGMPSSSLFEHLGDLYVKYGDKEKAQRAYMHAIDLSDDCLIVVPFVQKKLRKIK